MDHFYDSVPGWSSFWDTYTEALERTPDGGTLVEVGTHMGRSAAFMAVEIAKRQRSVRFVCVDAWTGVLSPSDTGPAVRDADGASLEAFMATMKRGGVDHVVEPMKADSAEAASQFADGSIDFVFIDAGHDYESCRKDICAWLPKVKAGGVLAGHDYGGGDDNAWPMVEVAVQNALPLSNISTRPDKVFWYENKPRTIGVMSRKPRKGSDYLLYIPVVNRLDLLQQALASLRKNGEQVEPLIIDQTADGIGLAEWTCRVTERLSFTQMMNWAIDVARVARRKYLVFMHADAECENNALDLALDQARALDAAGTKWGVIFTNYDALAVFNMEAIKNVGRWDETFFWYVSDCDFYRRLALHGYPAVHCPEAKVLHHASQTIKADPALAARARAEQRFAQDHYHHKWGGTIGQEVFTLPYHGRPRG